ncbi:STAS domain-containing protein [Alienimonas californiensis]|uniref:RsbT co-antagonist protein RsbRA n=1 Tax=Alienimonas californiensis TaxID=2527989 RepID=A0A517P4A4_9PLAN|nr:STAS domain-containing protein [Alienimonas californiensis]QDT14217.1 RsbT co-antagonist protein RsbRA [Alienimonas californiensis]
MSQSGSSRLPALLARHEDELLADWVAEQTAPGAPGAKRVREAELREQCREFLRLVREAAQSEGAQRLKGTPWDKVRAMLNDLARSRGTQGASPSETATFIFSLKRPLFSKLRAELGGDAGAFAEATWTATEMLDELGLYTTEVHQQAREDVINRQQQEMLELSTPVVKLWDGILALPLIGTLDSARTQVAMESLLQALVDTGSSVAIVDITGVPTVDTLTAQHLLKTVTAARLMGADCLISGIRPQIAQTIVHLGLDLGQVTTKSTMADAFKLALKKTGASIDRPAGRS